MKFEEYDDRRQADERLGAVLAEISTAKHALERATDELVEFARIITPEHAGAPRRRRIAVAGAVA